MAQQQIPIDDQELQDGYNVFLDLDYDGAVISIDEFLQMIYPMEYIGVVD